MNSREVKKTYKEYFMVYRSGLISLATVYPFLWIGIHIV